MIKIKKVLFVILLLVLILISLFVVANRKVYGVWNPFKDPLRVECFSRTYNLSANPKSIEMIGEKHPNYPIHQSFLDKITGKKLYMSDPKGEFVPTVIYLYDGENRFYVIELSGGP